MRSIWDSSGAGTDNLSCSKNRKKRIKKNSSSSRVCEFGKETRFTPQPCRLSAFLALGRNGAKFVKKLADFFPSTER